MMSRLISMISILLLTHSLAYAQSTPLLDSFIANQRSEFDFASRSLYFKQQRKLSMLHMFGLDFHSVIGDEHGDVGTFVLQTYLNRIDDLNPHPSHFSDEDDWALSVRTFSFNYTHGGLIAPNIRFGHVVLPFGIEHTVDTSGQLKDYDHRANLGLKADWGIGLNKQHQSFEYDIFYGLGSRQKLKKTADNHVFSGRIGSSSTANWLYGLSFYHAKLNHLSRRKFALDIQGYRALWGYKAELGWGRKDSNRTHDSLIELNWRNAIETFQAYAQASHHQRDNHPNQSFITIGALLEPSSHWSFGFKFSQALQRSELGYKQVIAAIQLRFRY